jgi:FAD/FMN-containing dehydrogenase
VKEEIQKFFKGDVDDSAETLSKYSHDASLLEVRPKFVLYPKDSADVQSIVKWVNYTKKVNPELSITARCAGTDMSGGSIGESIILDFTRYMNHLVKFIDDVPKASARIHLEPAAITVQPGMYYRDFEKITLEKGLILPCYTASKSLNAVGGMYGNNSAGERTLKYGKTEDYVLSAKVVFSDGIEYVVKPLNQKELAKKMAEQSFEGEVYKQIYSLIENNKEEIKEAKPKVHKNSAGYYIWNVFYPAVKNSSAFLQPAVGTFRGANSLPPKSPESEQLFDLNKILIGSQGTLGIVTEITFKVLPEIKHSNLVAVFMNELAPLGRLVDEMLTLNPETLETYDDKTLALAVKFFPDFLKTKGIKGMIKLAWSFVPEFIMMLRGGFPKMVLLAQFAGDTEEEVNKRCLQLVEKIKPFNLKTHITANEAEANKYWDIRRESFALLRKHVKGKRTAPFIDDIIVRPEFLPKFIPELNAILSKYDLTYTIAGHAGDGNFHIIPLMDFSRPDTAKIITELSDKVYDLVLRYHGSITAEHNDGIIRTPYLKQMYGERITNIFKEIKNIFDPKNILNPGKKVPVSGGAGTKEYIATHLAIEHKAEHKV